MKNAFLAAILSVFMFSCESNLPTNRFIEEPFIVKSIETHFQDTVVCVYNLQTRIDYVYYISTIAVVDSIGKFAIGDSVMFILNPR